MTAKAVGPDVGAHRVGVEAAARSQHGTNADAASDVCVRHESHAGDVVEFKEWLKHARHVRRKGFSQKRA